MIIYLQRLKKRGGKLQDGLSMSCHVLSRFTSQINLDWQECDKVFVAINFRISKESSENLISESRWWSSCHSTWLSGILIRQSRELSRNSKNFFVPSSRLNGNIMIREKLKEGKCLINHSTQVMEKPFAPTLLMWRTEALIWCLISAISDEGLFIHILCLRSLSNKLDT